MYHHDVIKLVIAAVCGILLGLEREIQHKPLGVKTCLVIAVASCLITIVSIDSSLVLNPVEGPIRADPMRLAAQIVSGTGFIGAGVIMRRNDEVVSGLTTAAMVWAAAGLGIAIGAGFYGDSVIGMLLILLIVHGYPLITNRYGPASLREKEVKLTLVLRRPANIALLTRQMTAIECRPERIKSTIGDDGTQEVTLHCVVDGNIPLDEIYAAAGAIQGVLSIEAKSLS